MSERTDRMTITKADRKLRRKTVGYIVIGPYGAMRADKRGVLWISHATLFQTRRAAQKAIDTTEEYRKRKGYIGDPWKKNNHWIRRVVA